MGRDLFAHQWVVFSVCSFLLLRMLCQFLNFVYGFKFLPVRLYFHVLKTFSWISTIESNGAKMK